MAGKSHTAVALTGPKTLGIIEVSTRSPDADEVLIKVKYASYGTSDAHAVDDGFDVKAYPDTLGLAAAGTVVEAGSRVDWLKAGDLAVAFTQPGGDRGIQEYVTMASHRVAKIPSNVQPQDAAAVIDNFVCAWWTVVSSFELPLPERFPSHQMIPSATMSSPVLIWGAGTAASMYTIQVLCLAGYTNIITTASSRTAPIAFAFGATHVFDYNDPDVTKKIMSVAGTSPIHYALDPVCTKSSLEHIAKLVKAPGSKVAVLIPIKVGDIANLSQGGAKLLNDFPQELNPFEMGVDAVPTYAFTWESDPKLKANLLTKILPALLESGQIKPQEVRLISEGSLLERVEKAAELVRSNKLSGAKAIIDFTV